MYARLYFQKIFQHPRKTERFTACSLIMQLVDRNELIRDQMNEITEYKRTFYQT